MPIGQETEMEKEFSDLINKISALFGHLKMADKLQCEVEKSIQVIRNLIKPHEINSIDIIHIFQKTHTVTINGEKFVKYDEFENILREILHNG